MNLSLLKPCDIMNNSYAVSSEKLPTYVEVGGVIFLVFLVFLVFLGWWTTFLTIAPIFTITAIAMRSNAKYDARTRESRNNKRNNE